MNEVKSTSALLGKEELIERITTKSEKRIFISPILSSKQIQPASIDVRLGPEFLVFKTGRITHLEPLRSPNEVRKEIQSYIEKYKILDRYDTFVLHPEEFVLGCTLEYVCLPTDIAGRLEGRSSWGRLGVLIHATAGFIDPGFRGNITFELKNMGKIPIPLYPGIRIGQLAFFNILNENTYCGKYQESFGIVPSEYFVDEEYDIIRNRCTPDYYENVVMEIFNNIENDKGLPILDHPYLTKDLIDSIATAYKRKYDQNMGDD
jgi:dCTP deaminase